MMLRGCMRTAGSCDMLTSTRGSNEAGLRTRAGYASRAGQRARVLLLAVDQDAVVAAHQAAVAGVTVHEPAILHLTFPSGAVLRVLPRAGRQMSSRGTERPAEKLVIRRALRVDGFGRRSWAASACWRAGEWRGVDD